MLFLPHICRLRHCALHLLTSYSVFHLDLHTKRPHLLLPCAVLPLPNVLSLKGSASSLAAAYPSRAGQETLTGEKEEEEEEAKWN